MSEKLKVFISHIHEDAPFGLKLKEFFERNYRDDFDVFISSDKKQIPWGEEWANEIRNALDECKMMFVVCSPVSITRPWIFFETGSAWVKRIPMIPICINNTKKEELPMMLQIFQATEFSLDFAKDLTDQVSKKLSRTAPLDLNFDFIYTGFLEVLKTIKYSGGIKQGEKPIESYQMNDIERQILVFLSKFSRGVESLPYEQWILDELTSDELPEQKVKYYFHQLLNKNFITGKHWQESVRNSLMTKTHFVYDLTDKGREWLIKNELL